MSKLTRAAALLLLITGTAEGGELRGSPASMERQHQVAVAGSWVLRAYPIAVGPPHPAVLTGTLVGDALTFRVTVNDTIAHTTVEYPPVTVTRGREPRMGPCPICRVPRALPSPRADRPPAKRLVRIL